MYQVFLSAAMAFLGSALRATVLKFAVYAVLLYISTEFVGYAVDFANLPSSAGVNSALGQLPSGVMYFLNVFQVPAGIAIMLSAYASRFLIRRIPFFG